MDNKKKFGLVMPKKSETSKIKPKSIFDSESDEDIPQRKCPVIPQKRLDSKAKVKNELLDDPSIYEYDNIYDEMKSKQAESIAPKKKQNSRYIDTLLKAADKRKKEYERRVEKKIQVERKKEGDKYKDKEAFVTSSYKKKMQEMEEEEERERRETMLNDMMDVTKQKDLSGFYRHFLKQTVGEEKIPTFGEKKDINCIKKEVISDEEKSVDRISKVIKSTIDTTNEKDIDKDIDRDSDGIEIDSDSQHSESSGNSSKIRHSSISSESLNGNCNDDKKKSNKKMKTGIKIKKNSKGQSMTRRKTSCTASESDSEEEIDAGKKIRPLSINKHSTAYNAKKNCTEKNIHRSRHDSLDSQNEKSLNLDDRFLDKHENTKEEKTKKRSINVKHTIGDVFVQAQARYFERMANRNS